MKISTLPKSIKSLIYENITRENDKTRSEVDYIIENGNLIDAFDWSKALEGLDFWSSINKGNLPEEPEINLSDLMKQISEL